MISKTCISRYTFMIFYFLFLYVLLSRNKRTHTHLPPGDSKWLFFFRAHGFTDDHRPKLRIRAFRSTGRRRRFVGWGRWQVKPFKHTQFDGVIFVAIHERNGTCMNMACRHAYPIRDIIYIYIYICIYMNVYRLSTGMKQSCVFLGSHGFGSGTIQFQSSTQLFDLAAETVGRVLEDHTNMVVLYCNWKNLLHHLKLISFSQIFFSKDFIISQLVQYDYGTVDGWNPKQPPGMVLKPYK